MRSGIDVAHVDPAVRPQDDLFRHVNGTWLRESTIPADRAFDGAFYALREKAEADLRDIIERTAEYPDGPAADQVGDLYASFMDEQTADERGLTRSGPSWTAHSAWPTRPTSQPRSANWAAAASRARSAATSTPTPSSPTATSSTFTRADSACRTSRTTTATTRTRTCAARTWPTSRRCSRWAASTTRPGGPPG
ncbi:MAG: hypothetical protein ACRDWI_17030 [Jiangellaceae bacterium]